MAYPNRLGSVEAVVQYQLGRLSDVVHNGLDPVYDSFGDFLYDFYPGFSWNSQMVAEVKALMQHPQFDDVARGIQQKHSFDMRTELQEAVDDMKEQYGI